MKKIATITFHGAHNYGSNLQAYALQEYISNICKENNIEFKYDILNLRTTRQNELYSINKKNNTIKNIIKNVMSLPYRKKLNSKSNKFEDFINNKLNVTKNVYKNEDEIRTNSETYDYYISGSDQVWNVRALDFDWSNMLGFADLGKKISYAASFGPLNIDWEKYDKNKCNQLLKKYDFVSTRELGSFNSFKEITGKDSEIHVDPTLLLKKDEWIKLIGNSKLIKSKYIFFYSLEPSLKDIELVKSISKKLGLPVVISKYCNKYDYFNSFIKQYDSGPIEFLNLINNAELVISSSFHGTVFSILFNKPFLSINGDKDNRISDLLNISGLMERAVNYSDWETKCNNNIFELDFSKANEAIEFERNRSKKYLEKALDISIIE